MNTYNSVGEIYEALDQTRERLRATLAELGDGHESFRESAERWTIAEIVEHLAIIEGRMIGLVKKLVRMAEAEGAPRANADGSIPPVELDEIVELAQREKFQAPETVLPTGGAGLKEALAHLDEARDVLRSLRPRVEAFDLSAYRFPHPIFGPLDLYQWLAVHGFHEERHRRQIEALKASATGQAAAQP